MLNRLLKKELFLVIWCIVAAFGVYFCTYAFRKPFNAGLYEGFALFGVGYKTVLIISQMLGYVISKFWAIKFVSKLNPAKRIFFIVLLVALSETALIGFGIVPYPYNFMFMFLNGLPLGFIYGIIFSFLEGRRFTEMLSIGLSISMIIGSGILKSTYFSIKHFLNVSEFWMPAVEGLVFAVPFIFFVWMLSKIPAQTQKDMKEREARTPMKKTDRRNLLGAFGIGIFGIVFINALLTVIRDFRDDFMVEITSSIGIANSQSIFSKIEFFIGIFVLVSIGLLSFIRSNKKSFAMMHGIIFGGLCLMMVSSALYLNHIISPLIWFISLGCGIFLAYITIQSVYFDRFIAVFRPKGNAAYMICISDTAGYSCTIMLLVYREFFATSVSWANVLIYLSFFVGGGGILSLIVSALYFYRKAVIKEIRVTYMKHMRRIIGSNKAYPSDLMFNNK